MHRTSNMAQRIPVKGRERHEMSKLKGKPFFCSEI